MVNGITSVNYGINTDYSDFDELNTGGVSDINEETNIFEAASYTNEETATAENAEILYEKLSEVEDEQGVISNAWNSFKELTNIGTSVEKCDNAIQQYQNGEISFEEAAEIIDNFDSKQESSLNLFSNIAVSVAAIAAGAAALAATGGLAAPIVAGALAGAVTKAGVKTVDRATNDVEGDALDAKQIAQDALSGAVTGGIAAATAGSCANTFANGGTAACALKGAKTGVITGAVSGSSNYAIDCAFDEDQDFDLKEFAATTAESAAVGGTVGLIMGGATGFLRSANILNAADDNVIVNGIDSASYKVLNDRIRQIA